MLRYYIDGPRSLLLTNVLFTYRQNGPCPKSRLPVSLLTAPDTSGCNIYMYVCVYIYISDSSGYVTYSGSRGLPEPYLSACHGPARRGRHKARDRPFHSPAPGASCARPPARRVHPHRLCGTSPASWCLSNRADSPVRMAGLWAQGPRAGVRMPGGEYTALVAHAQSLPPRRSWNWGLFCCCGDCGPTACAAFSFACMCPAVAWG